MVQYGRSHGTRWSLQKTGVAKFHALPTRLFPQDLNADFDKALASPSQATREVSHGILVVECLQVGTVFHVALCFLRPWAPVSWIATRLDLRLFRLSKWAWAYIWYTDASNRAGNSLSENWKHQWIFGESKLKPSIYICFHLICLSQIFPKHLQNHQLSGWLALPEESCQGISDLSARHQSINGWKHLASPFRTMDAVPSPIASVAWASWCRRCLQSFFFVCWVWNWTVFFFPWVDIYFLLGEFWSALLFFFVFSISDFFMISCKNHILDCTYFLRCLVTMVLLHVLGLCYSFVERKNGPR